MLAELLIAMHGQSYVIVLDELPGAAHRQAEGTQHAFVFLEQGIFPFLVLDVDIESLALKEQFQIAIVLQDGVRSAFVEHALQCLPPRLNEVGIETTYGLLFRRRRDDDARIVIMELVVQPEEIAVAAGDGKFRIPVSLRGSLGSVSPATTSATREM